MDSMLEEEKKPDLRLEVPPEEQSFSVSLFYFYLFVFLYCLK